MRLAIGSVNDDQRGLIDKDDGSIQSTPVAVEESICPEVPGSLFTS